MRIPVSLAIAMALACSKSPPTATPIANTTAPSTRPAPFATPDDAAVAALAFMDKMVAAVLGADGDCKRMAGHLQQLSPEIKRLKERSRVIEDDPALKKQLADKYKDQMTDRLTKLFRALQKCSDAPEIKAFFEQLNDS